MPGNLSDIISILIKIVNEATNIVVLLAFLFFAWGISQFILNANNQEKRQKAKGILVWGIVILFLIISINGIIYIITGTFLGSDVETDIIPTSSFERESLFEVDRGRI